MGCSPHPRVGISPQSGGLCIRLTRHRSPISATPTRWRSRSATRPQTERCAPRGRRLQPALCKTRVSTSSWWARARAAFAALAAARTGARTLLSERADGLGGTGVYSPVGLVCQFYARDGRPINTGIHRELFPAAYRDWRGTFHDTDPVPVYDECELAATYRRLAAAEPLLTVWTGRQLTAVERDGDGGVGAGALHGGAPEADGRGGTRCHGGLVTSAATAFAAVQ